MCVVGDGLCLCVFVCADRVLMVWVVWVLYMLCWVVVVLWWVVSVVVVHGVVGLCVPACVVRVALVC